MQYTILGLRKGEYVPIATANGPHALAAIHAFREKTHSGRKVRAVLSAPLPAGGLRIGLDTPLLVCDGYTEPKAYAKGNKPLVTSPPTPPQPFLKLSDAELDALRSNLLALENVKHNPDKGIHPWCLLCSSHLLPEPLAILLMEVGRPDFKEAIRVKAPK